MKEYSWSIKGFFDDMDATKVGEELELLGDEILPERVVEVAKNENSEMHNYFEWDDAKAGQEYRIIQARKIIGNLKVTIVKSEITEPIHVRAFVNTKRNTGYKNIEAVISNVDEYALLLSKAYKELTTIKEKYQQLEEIQELLKDIPNE